jgi:hypothetical protein
VISIRRREPDHSTALAGKAFPIVVIRLPRPVSTADYFSLATSTTRAEIVSTNCQSRDLKGSAFAGVRAAQ